MAATVSRRNRVLIIVGASVVALIVLFFVADAIARNVAQSKVEQEISSNLPEGVTGDVNVAIGGFSVIGQFLAGNFEQVQLTSSNLAVNGATAVVDVVAKDVPTNTAKQIGSVTGTIDLDQKSLNTLLSQAVNVPDATLELRDGDVSYSGSIEVFGTSIGYTATAVPQAAGDTLYLTPTSAELTSSLGSLDVSGVVNLILGQKPVAICVAEYLPEGVTLTGVDVTPERLQITLASNTLSLSPDALNTLGSCSAG
ncbi:DUF2993 domain-containing protein [Leifsonia sp. YAF41]|uniref:LmeA family phospholipid-binding protein n=1 Tax=Leifsonia sp. YAF41 TaxID=3233086 RepID=UPI003F96C243